MRRRRAALGLAVVALASRAFAGATDPLVPASVAPAPGVTVPTSFEPWTMTAATPQAFEAERIEKGPCDGRLACTEWSIEPTFSFQPDGGQCAVTTIGVKVSVRHRLPTWEPSQPLPPSAETWWRRVLPEIIAHEGGHRDLAVETGNRLMAALSALPAEATCPLLVKRARSEATRLIEEGEQRQRDYDAKTERAHRRSLWE